MHLVNRNSDTFLCVSGDVFVQALLKCCVFCKFSAAFADVRSFVHNNSTGTFVNSFGNYALSLLIWRLACRSVAVGLSRYFKAYAKVMPSVTANKRVFRTCSRS